MTGHLHPASEEKDGGDLTPSVRRLLGIAEGGSDEEDYRRYLLEKYGTDISPADRDTER